MNGPAKLDQTANTQEQPLKPHFFSGLLSALTIAGLLFTAATFNASNHWLADLIAQFRVQLALGAGLVCVLLLILKRWKFALLCIVGCAVNAWPVLPYLLPGDATNKKATESEISLRLLTANVLTKNRNWSSLIEIVRKENPDFIVLMEVDSAWKKAIEALAEDYPYSTIESRGDNFGIAFLSKLPWSQMETVNSQSLSLPSIDVRFETGFGQPLRILATHPIPPMNRNGWEARNEQLFNMVGRLDETSANIMTGDFNLTPWSPVFTKVCEDGGLRDSAIGFGAEPTWHIFPTVLGGLKLDHILISDQLVPLSHRIGPDFGSDHLPVILDFEIPQEP